MCARVFRFKFKEGENEKANVVIKEWSLLQGVVPAVQGILVDSTETIPLFWDIVKE